MKWKKWIRPALFTLGGALAGLAYYQWIGCASGSCVITSSPVGSMLYMGADRLAAIRSFQKGAR